MKGIVQLIIPLSLFFGGAAALVGTQGSSVVTAPAGSEIAVSANYTNASTINVNENGQYNWPQVNFSEYLAITYGPATKFHQVMSDRASCTTCHHHSGNEIRACKDCHDKPFDPTNSSKPGLKAAYHQRCMSCHRDVFNGPDSCKFCHTGGTLDSSVLSGPPIPHQLTWDNCRKCHSDGIPGGREETKIVYHDNCLKCHTKGVAGAKAVPADHAGRDGNTCQGCHRPKGG